MVSSMYFTISKCFTNVFEDVAMNYSEIVFLFCWRLHFMSFLIGPAAGGLAAGGVRS